MKYKVDFVGMVDYMVLADNVNMADSFSMVNKQRTFGYLKLLVDTSGLAQLTSIVPAQPQF